MTSVTIIVLLTGIPAAIGLALLAIVTAAIHAEERALSLPAAPASRTRRLARRITGVYVSQPLATRAFAARHTAMPAPAPRAASAAPAHGPSPQYRRCRGQPAASAVTSRTGTCAWAPRHGSRGCDAMTENPGQPGSRNSSAMKGSRSRNSPVPIA
jgi:hypothetical protein